MVRYELILHRRPKIGAKEVEKRMGDMPKELSKGTLERALENLDGGSIPIAWGSSRKRLRLIQRRMEILGGATQLVDHGGAFAKALTAISDEIRYLFGEKREVKAHKPRVLRDPTQPNYIFLTVCVVAALLALVFARGVHDANARLWATQAAGFVLGVSMSRVFVRGVRRWFSEQGKAWISVCMMLVPVLSLSAAGYEAYALGIVQEAAGQLAKQTRLAPRKPLMKPFAALIVELKQRKQRAELAAALASAAASKTAEAANAAAGAAEAAAPAEPAHGKRQAARRKRGKRAEAAAPESTTMNTTDTQPSAAAQPSAVVRPKPPAAVQQTAAEPPVVAEPAPVDVPVLERALRPKLLQQLESWPPLRTVADLNEVHVGGAILLALLAFIVGVWTGRSRRWMKARALAAVAPEPPLESPDAAIPADPESPPRAATPAVEAEEAKLEACAALPPVTEIAASKPEAPAAKPAPSVPPAAPANDNIAAAAAKPLEDTGTEDRKAKRRREGAPGSAYSARGSIQEEHVVRKRRDARND